VHLHRIFYPISSSVWCILQIFALNYLTLMYDGVQLIVVDALYQCTRLISIVLHNNEKLPCAAFKIGKINKLLQNLRKWFGCRSHDERVSKHLKPWSEQFACIRAPMCTPIKTLFFILSVSCLPQTFDARMLSFLSHYWIPVLWWVYDATVLVLLKCFCSCLCGHVQTHTMYCVMAKRCFIVPVIRTIRLQ